MKHEAQHDLNQIKLKSIIPIMNRFIEKIKKKNKNKNELKFRIQTATILSFGQVDRRRKKACIKLHRDIPHQTNTEI